MEASSHQNNGIDSTSSSLSFSHLIIQLLVECTDHELITNTRYITSLVASSAAFEANKHVSDDTIKTIAQNCFQQEQTIAQVSTTISNLLNCNNQQLSKVFQRFASLILIPMTSPAKITMVSAGLTLLHLFIQQCDYPLLSVSAVYLHQTLTTFMSTQQSTRETKSNLPTSHYLRALQVIIALYTRASTPGWTSALQTLPSLRTTLDAMFLTAFRALQVPQERIDLLDSDEYPELKSILPAPISTITTGTLAVVEFILQLLHQLLSNNAILPLCKTHIPHTHSLIMLLVDLDIHSTTYLSTQTNITGTTENALPSQLRIGNRNRLLPLMGQVFALSCYAGKFNDIKQALTIKSNKANGKSGSSGGSSLLLPFPAEIFLHGLSPQIIHNNKSKSDANPTGVARKAKNTFDIDTFLNTAKADDEGNGILIDTTKTAEKAITGGSGDLKLQGGIVTKDVHQRKFQGDSHLLALKVAADDKIAAEFLTDEFQTTQQGIYNKQQQMIHLDLKRCIATMLITTIVNHLIQVLPPILSSYQTLLGLQQSLYTSQVMAGFNTDVLLGYELLDLKSIHRDNLQYQQLIISRTTALLTLLDALLSISPSSLQQNGQIGSAMNNIAWLGFGAPGSTFMQSTFRELSASHQQQTHNLKVRAILTDSAGGPNGNNNNNDTNNDIHQIYLTTPPVLPTSLSMTFATQNEQWHTQQMNQQQFQFESPLFRILQLLFTVFELEINSITMTKELALLQQFLPSLQIITLNIFKTIVITAGKQISIYVNTFMPQLFQLYQTTTQNNRTTYLLGSHTLLILQQQLLSTFSLLLTQFSSTIFTTNILTQFVPLILFDLMSYFHDLTHVQQQFRLIGATQKENKNAKSQASITKSKKDEDGDEDYKGGANTTLSLNKVTTSIFNAKTFTFTPHTQDKLGRIQPAGSINAPNGSQAQLQQQLQQQSSILNDPSTQHIVPHSLQFPTTAQQQQLELYIIDLCNVLTNLFSTSTSTLIVTNDIFTSIGRIVTTILHTILTPFGSLLLPIPQPTLLALFKLLNALTMYKPSVGTLSPLLTEATQYFTWALQLPYYDVVQYAKKCLWYYNSLTAPALIVPTLPVETITVLNQLRDRAILSLQGGDTVTSTVKDTGNDKYAFGHGSVNATTTTATTTGKGTSSGVNPFGLFDPNTSFPLMLYPFQQGLGGNHIDQTNTSDNNDNALENIMLSMYHQRVRTIQFTAPGNNNNNNNNNINSSATKSRSYNNISNNGKVDNDIVDTIMGNNSDDGDEALDHLAKSFHSTTAMTNDESDETSEGEESDNNQPINIVINEHVDSKPKSKPTPTTTQTKPTKTQFALAADDDIDLDGDLDIDFV